MSIKSFVATLGAGLTAIPLFVPIVRAEPASVTGPVVHENVAVYLLRGKSAAGPVPLTLAEALDKQSIEVVETGNVRELKIENKGAEPVFVQLGDIVKGGRQDRVLTVSLLLEPKSGVVPIGAYCVEQGRWSARDKEDAHRFARSEALLPSREAKVAIARPAGPGPVAAAPSAPRALPIETELNAVLHRDMLANLQRQAQSAGGVMAGDLEQRNIAASAGRPSDSQGEVWRNVHALQRLLSNNLSTSVANERSRTSLQLSLENDQLKAAQGAYVTALEPAGLADDDVIGVAIAVGGRMVSADLYPSNGLFRKMWPKIVRAASTEAIALKETSQSAAAPPTIEAVKDFLAAAEAGSRSEHALGTLARLETREAEKVLSVKAIGSAGGLVHRSYMAK